MGSEKNTPNSPEKSVDSEVGKTSVTKNTTNSSPTVIRERCSLDSQLSKKLDLVSAGPKLIIPPAQHLLSSALKVPLYAASKPFARSAYKSTIDDEDTLDGDAADREGQGADEGDDDPDDTGDNDNERFVDAMDEACGNVEDMEAENSAADNVRKGTLVSSPSLSNSRSLLSPSSLTSEARKMTLSSQRLVSTISKKSISPIKTGVTSVGMVALKPIAMPPIISKKQPEMAESTIDGISRSFAGYLTTASMFAGFQDFEAEDKEVESIRDRTSELSESFDSAISCAPDDATTLKMLDDEDVDDGSVSIERTGNDRETPLSVDKDTLNNIPISKRKSETSAPLLRSVHRNGSKFELSIVKRFSKNSDLSEQQNTMNQNAGAMYEKLSSAFDIDENEEFLNYYPCWLMGDVLLQGHIYVTDRNILFLAFLPKKNDTSIIKAGALSIKSFHSLRMHRKWIILREHTFSVYSSSTDLYFPELVIDLRTALRAETYGTSKASNLLVPVWVKIVTENRTHWFQAENYDAAKVWVRILKRQIFSSRNKGDEVAIKIPLQNIIDLELTFVVGTTRNLRIKVIENSESFAIDDYFVMFFANGDKAINDIKSSISNAGVEISSSYQSDDDDWKNSDLFKSKVELLKKSASSVESTNLVPKAKKSRFREIRDAILSSDDDVSDTDDDTDQNIARKTNPLRFKGRMFPASSIDSKISENNKPNAIKKLLPDMTRSKSKSSHLVPEISHHDSVEKIIDSRKEKNEKEDDSNVSYPHRGLTKSFVHGITSFTQNLIFSGPPLHFDESLSISKEGQDPYFVKDKITREKCQKRFRKRFTLGDSENLLATYHLYLMRSLPNYGKMYIGTGEVCFRSTIPGSSTLMILPLRDIENVNKESGFRFGYYGLVIVIKGHEELFFEFSNSESRDDCEVQLLKRLDIFRKTNCADSAEGADKNIYDLEAGSTNMNSARLKMFENKLSDDVGVSVPIIIEDHPLQKTQFKAIKSYRFTLLTIGSRGDVQPYIALGKALLKEGHQVKIVTHQEFKDWVLSYGIQFDSVAGDPSELMALMVSNPSINYSFIKEAKAKFGAWIDDLLHTSWKACQDTDVLIESPSSIAGIHIAEKLQIPYFRAFTMPWTRTRAYPHAFLVPDQKLGGAYNYMTHVAFENGYWRGTAYQVNKWREKTLGLPSTSLSAMHQNSVPFLYNMSPVVFPPSIDFPECVKVTGYWFLDESGDYKPPKELTDFIQKSRDDGKKLVYIGFGSIVVSNPRELTEAVVQAVLESDVRCILNKGWSDRLGSKDNKKVEVDLPPEIFNSGNVPHDWLFTQIDAAVHHGGSGTTGASLRFGLPTIIKPFFGDQKFYASRVEDLGCGVHLRSLESSHLAKALKEVTTNKRIIENAKNVGEQIRKENGVQTAVDWIYVLMDYAKKLSISKHKHDIEKVADESVDDSILDNNVDGSWLLV